MTLTLADLLRLAAESVRTPREGVRKIRSFELVRTLRWQALLLVVVLSVLLSELTAFLTFGDDMLMGVLLGNPMAAAVIQIALMVVMVFAVFWIGRAMGGQGSLDDTILLIAWMQFIMVLLQVVQTVSLIVMPPLSGLIGIGGLFLFFWLLTNFVAELHGFVSLGRVFMMIILSMIAIAFVLTLLVPFFGISVSGA